MAADPSVIGHPMQQSSTEAELHPWDQHPDENDLWYARFVRFVALGPTRSVSLVAKGYRNAYPVPAHWPMQAKQMHWRERATAFDQAVKADSKLLAAFEGLIVSLQVRLTNGEQQKLVGVTYQPPPPDDDYEDDLPSRTTAH